jgi:rhamnulose-1-phosphate aldolase/alcohol dehydrogenase
VSHTHADAVLALTNNAEGRRTVADAFGKDAALVPYRRPGFLLAKEVFLAVKANPAARAVVLEKHGLITWGGSSRESYDRTIEFVSRAEEFARAKGAGKQVFGPLHTPGLPPEERRRALREILPVLRGALSRRNRVILHVEGGEDVLAFAGSEKAPHLAAIGPATPDHLVYTKRLPLFLDPSLAGSAAGASARRANLERTLEACAREYAAWFARHAPPGTEPPDPCARVFFLPGVGVITQGRDAKAARLVAEIVHHTIAVIGAANGIAPYESLSEKDAFDIESWPLETYRLSLAPPERELARRIVLVTGAASGIGKAIALRFAEEDAHVALADLDPARVHALAKEICERHGAGRAIGLAMDVTREAEVARAFDDTVLAFGGLDILVSNAGIARAAPVDRMETAAWEESLAVNATGHFFAAREAVRILKEQGRGGNLLFIASKNVLAPGRDFGAYSAAKAAETQLARILAIEGGEHGIRANIVNPDAVFQDSNLWSPGIREERARAHGVAPGELEEFYRKRNLLRVTVSGRDVAEAALYLVSERAAKTTGCILTVDGGVREAFPR